MKLVFRRVLFVAILFSFACTKESDIGDFDSKKVSIDVSALVEELNADDKTKSEVLLVMRHFWSEADVVYAYDNTKLLGSLRVTPINNNRDAQLTGTIDAPSSKSSIITLIYCNTADEAPVIDDGGKVTFDFSAQNGSKIPCVVYGTIDYSNQPTITNQVVTFHFATSFMELTVTGLNDTGVDSILISGVNTVCELTVKPDAGPGIAGNAVGTIKKTGNITKSGERAIFAVAIVQDKHTNRVITVAQGEKRFKSNFTAAGLNGNAVYFSVYALKEELTGTLLGHEYVVIAGKKWATMNVGATEVVGPNSYGDYYVWGTIETAYSGIDRANGTFVFKEANPYGDRLGVEWQPAVGFEINPRRGGGNIQKYIKEHSGVDLTRLIVQLSVGDRRYFNEIKGRGMLNKYITKQCVFSGKSGYFRKLEIHPEIKCFVVAVHLDIKEGDWVEACRDYQDKIGEVVLRFENREQQLEYYGKIEDFLCVELK